MRRILIVLIRVYQKTFSFDHGVNGGLQFSGCRFYPSCSDYTCQALQKYGFFRGVLLGVKRISRCHPLSRGGVDKP